jgi:hypothetical protein
MDQKGPQPKSGYAKSVQIEKAAAELPQSMELPRDILPFLGFLAQCSCFAERVRAE